MIKYIKLINTYIFSFLMKVYFNMTDEIVKTTDDAISHGCNTKGVMGRGAAFAIKQMYDVSMYIDYIERCSSGMLKPGDAYRYKQEGLPILYNLAIQSKPGRHASIISVHNSLKKLSDLVEEDNIKSLSITPIGAINGGLESERVINEIYTAFQGTPIIINIYMNPRQEAFEMLLNKGVIPETDYLDSLKQFMPKSDSQ
jgi:O-acetyl-ADP-ribose deacetylase (regulator of RNase III)